MAAVVLWGILDYAGLDAEGNIHLFLRKQSKGLRLIRELKNLEKRRVLVTVRRLDGWEEKSEVYAPLD